MDEEVTFDKISSVEKILFSLGIHTFVTSSSVRHSPATFPAGEGSFAPPRGGANEPPSGREVDFAKQKTKGAIAYTIVRIS